MKIVFLVSLLCFSLNCFSQNESYTFKRYDYKRHNILGFTTKVVCKQFIDTVFKYSIKLDDEGVKIFPIINGEVIFMFQKNKYFAKRYLVSSINKISPTFILYTIYDCDNFKKHLLFFSDGFISITDLTGTERDKYLKNWFNINFIKNK